MVLVNMLSVKPQQMHHKIIEIDGKERMHTHENCMCNNSQYA